MKPSLLIVTGSSGFIGGRISYYFASLNYLVIAPLRSQSSLLLPHKNIITTSYDLVGSCLNGVRPSAIIHCAALTSANAFDDDLIYSTNIQLANLVTEWAGSFAPAKVVFLSTVSIYGNIRDNILQVGTSPISPNKYGLSKLASEALLTYRCIELGIPIAIIRLPGTVGYGSHGNIISKVFYASMCYNPRTPTKKIVISNPNSLFNNIVAIGSLLLFIRQLLSGSNMNLPVLLTLLSSTHPLPFKEVIEYIASSFSVRHSDLFIWSETTTTSFQIDCSHAELLGYEPLSTKESLDMVRSDILNPYYRL